MPSKEWMHNYIISDYVYYTLKEYLEINLLPVPYHCNDNDMTIFDRACYGEIPELEKYKPEE